MRARNPVPPRRNPALLSAAAVRVSRARKHPLQFGLHPHDNARCYSPQLAISLRLQLDSPPFDQFAIDPGPATTNVRLQESRTYATSTCTERRSGAKLTCLTDAVGAREMALNVAQAICGHVCFPNAVGLERCLDGMFPSELLSQCRSTSCEGVDARLVVEKR